MQFFAETVLEHTGPLARRVMLSWLGQGKFLEVTGLKKQLEDSGQYLRNMAPSWGRPQFDP